MTPDTAFKDMTPEQQMRRRYFTSQGLGHMYAMRLLHEGEALGPQPQGVNIFRGVSEHTVVQIGCSEAVGKMLGLPNEQVELLKWAAAFHDHTKKAQVVGLANILARYERGEISREECGTLQAKFFYESEEGSRMGMDHAEVSSEIIGIASSDGHTALPQMIEGRATPLQRVFHYIGDIVADTMITPLDARIDKIEANPKYAHANAYGRNEPWTHGQTYYQTQREVGHQIEREIAQATVTAGTLPRNLEERIMKDPSELPKIIMIYWHLLTMNYDNPEIKITKTKLWEFAVLNPDGILDLCPSEYADPNGRWFYEGVPPVVANLPRTSRILLAGTGGDHINVLNTPFGADQRIVRTTYITHFWEAFFDSRDYLDTSGISFPGQIITTGRMRHYDGMGNLTENVLPRLQEISSQFKIPLTVL